MFASSAAIGALGCRPVAHAYARRLPAVLLALSSAIALVQCNLGPKEGGKCSSAKGTCLSSTDALFCVGVTTHAGKYERVRCLGPDGCKSSLGTITCDTTRSEVGTACPDSLDGKGACDADDKALLTCAHGRWDTQAKCGGSKGCSSAGTNLSCDQSVGTPGDGCTHEGRMACTSDGRERLVCKDGKMVEELSCGGPAACHVDGTDVSCDGPAHLLGAPCQPEGSAACMADGKTHLSCKGGKNVDPVTCHGAHGCALVEAGMIYCDRSLAEAGEPCVTDKAPACSVDGTQMLACKDGAYATVRACRTSCKIVGSTAYKGQYSVACR